MPPARCCGGPRALARRCGSRAADRRGSAGPTESRGSPRRRSGRRAAYRRGDRCRGRATRARRGSQTGLSILSKLAPFDRPIVGNAPAMRANRFPWPREHALALLAAADTVRFALLDDDGSPILRCLHAVLDDDALCFHGSRRGTKSRGVGRPAVASVERTLAIVPSYAFDPERACPATTWYQSVQVRGTLVRVEDPHRKARVLQALMERLQGEGGHARITADHPLYQRAIDGLDVLALPLDEVSGRAKLGQNRSDAQVRRALECLWRRGDPGIDAVIGEILDARPELEVPEFLRGPE